MDSHGTRMKDIIGIVKWVLDRTGKWGTAWEKRKKRKYEEKINDYIANRDTKSLDKLMRKIKRERDKRRNSS